MNRLALSEDSTRGGEREKKNGTGYLRVPHVVILGIAEKGIVKWTLFDHVKRER